MLCTLPQNMKRRVYGIGLFAAQSLAILTNLWPDISSIRSNCGCKGAASPSPYRRGGAR